MAPTPKRRATIAPSSGDTGSDAENDETMPMDGDEQAKSPAARPQLQLDKKTEQGFVAFFRGLPPKASDKTLRLFERDRGDYYSVHGDDALFVAQHVYKTSTVIKYLGGDATAGIAGVCVSRMQTTALLKDLLLNRQYRIEIYASPSGGNSWILKLKGSPGNLQDFEELLFHSTDMDSSPVVIAVRLGSTTATNEKVIGVASADATSRRFHLCELPMTDTFANFEALVVQMGAKECLLPEEANNYELNKLREILEHCGVVVTDVKKGSFTTKNIEQDLVRLLPEDRNVTAMAEFELKVALSSLAALITYLELLGNECNFGQFRLDTFDLSMFMKLDAAAAKALNLMPDLFELPNQAMSLFSLLNKCRTPQGTRLLQQWLKQPLLDLSEITTRLDILSHFVANTPLRQTLRDDDLRKIPDLGRLAKRFQRGNAHLQDVVRTYQACLRLPSIIKAFEAHSANDCEDGAALLDTAFVKPLQKHAKTLDRFVEMVETTVDLDAVANHEFMIRPEYNETLKDLREKMDQIVHELPTILSATARELGLDAHKKIKLENSNIYGYYFRVNRTESNVLRGRKEYTELSTQKSGVFFTTNKLKPLSEKHADYTSQYDKVQKELVKEVIKVCATYTAVLESVNETISHMDVLLSFADVSVHAPTPYVRPTLSPMGEGDLILKNARHACLEVQPDVTFIANDVEMIRDVSEFQIITGANMGGKSTYIRQIGMIILLAQIGCFVPCDSATIPICDAILARVGAGDSQLKGVSTFMAEMLETATILKNATHNSFIIIDELGRGTSTYDGFGLAWAISEDIATRIKCFCLFATHFHELTALSDQVKSVKNMHVTTHVSDSAITLLYKVEPGICDQSFGIHVAQLAQFPQAVVNLAKRKAAELEDFSSNGTSTSTVDIQDDADQETSDRQMHEFLTSVRALPMAQMSNDDMLAALQRLRDDFLGKATSLVRQTLEEL